MMMMIHVSEFVLIALSLCDFFVLWFVFVIDLIENENEIPSKSHHNTNHYKLKSIHHRDNTRLLKPSTSMDVKFPPESLGMKLK